MCFMSFLTSLGRNLSFSRAVSDYLRTTPGTPVVTIIRGLTLHPAIFNVSMRGPYIFPLMALFGIYYGNRWFL